MSPTYEETWIYFAQAYLLINVSVFLVTPFLSSRELVEQELEATVVLRATKEGVEINSESLRKKLQVTRITKLLCPNMAVQKSN